MFPTPLSQPPCATAGFCMKDDIDLAHAWLDKARSDLHATELMIVGEGPYDTACFHAQQTIEKSLKALLAFHGKPIPKSHDLEELQRTCQLIHPIPELIRLDLSEATDFAVQLRYDVEFWPEIETAMQAYHLAKQVLKLITIELGGELPKNIGAF